MNKLTVHPLAGLVPMMAAKEYAAFKTDIAENGQQDAIVLYQGQILDGRHRLRACRELGIEPRTVEYDGDSPVRFVLSANLHRRHLTASQKAFLASDALSFFEAEANERQGTRTDLCEHSGKNSGMSPEGGEAREHAAAAFGVNPRYVQDAKTINAADPKLAAKVRAGKVKINKAIEQIKREHRRVEAEARVVDLADTGVEVHHGDFRDQMARLPKHSVDLILSDPPYTKEFLPIFGDLGEQSARVLRPGCSLVVMIGNMYFRELIDAIDPHIPFFWPLAYVMPGPTMLVHNRRIRQGWKQVLWFTDRKMACQDDHYVYDVVTSESSDKGNHDWGQSVSGFSQLVDRFSEPGQLVLDPFCGSGTTLVAAAKLGRRSIGIDIDESCVAISRSRVADAVKAGGAAA